MDNNQIRTIDNNISQSNIPEKPLVSFFMASYNRKQVVLDTLDHLYIQKYRPIEIIVLDDNSSDGTADEIEKQFPDVQLIRKNENIGGIAGRNMACQKATGKYVVSLDDDSFPGEHCIVRMVKEFEADPMLGLISFNVYNHKSFVDNYFDEAHLKPNRSHAENYFWSGCGGGYRREIVEKYGYWEEWGHTSPFELGISAKVMRAGMYGKNFSDIYVFHRFAYREESSDDNSSKKWGYPVEKDGSSRTGELGFFTSSRNLLLFVFKYYPINVGTLIWLIKFTWACSLGSIQKRNIVLIKAYFSGWSKMTIIKKERIPLSTREVKKIPLSFNFRGK
jgi:glycosyltransferase involved in cell wall biosynthesis